MKKPPYVLLFPGLIYIYLENAIMQLSFSLLGHEYKRRTCEPRLIKYNSWHGVVLKDREQLYIFSKIGA